MPEPLICNHCGAAVDVPADIRAVTARCAFCNNQVPLPPAIVAARRSEVQAAEARENAQRQVAAAQNTVRAGRKMLFWIVAIFVGPPILFAILGIVVALVAAGSKSVTTPSIPISIPTPTPVPTPARVIPTDSLSTGESQVTDVMKRLHAKGCRNIIMPPDRMQGSHTLSTKFVVNGTCVRIVAITGVPDNRITLAMKTPFGEVIPVPPPSTVVDFTYCPKTEGPHPTEISPATDDYYTVAALECPKNVK